MKVISVEGVSKKFILAHDRPRNLADAARGMFRRKQREDFWALKDVSFEVEQGEALGIIGHNGAGKSTMLKLLTRIMDPTKGRIRTRGRISALIEVGAGFHPEMTGRENIYLNGSILGMTRREIDSKFDEIVAFAELEKFIDTPVKRYSSGMYARLGMGVAVHVDPEILIVDEVLAVGDFAFQAKCVRAMQERRQRGTTVVFVSHNMGSVEGLCDRALLLDHGMQMMLGKVSAVVGAYRSIGYVVAGVGDYDLSSPDIPRRGDGSLRLTRIRFVSDKGETASQTEMGSPMVIEVHYVCQRAIDNPELALQILTDTGLEITRPLTNDHGFALHVKPGTGVIRYVIPHLYLHPGEYTVIPYAWDGSGFGCYDHLDTGVTLAVCPGAVDYPIRERAGLVHLRGHWEHSAADADEPPTLCNLP